MSRLSGVVLDRTLPVEMFWEFGGVLCLDMSSTRMWGEDRRKEPAHGWLLIGAGITASAWIIGLLVVDGRDSENFAAENTIVTVAGIGLARGLQQFASREVNFRHTRTVTCSALYWNSAPLGQGQKGMSLSTSHLWLHANMKYDLHQQCEQTTRHGADNDIDDDRLICTLLPCCGLGGQMTLLYIPMLLHDRPMAGDLNQEAMMYQIGHDVVLPHQEKHEWIVFFIDQSGISDNVARAVDSI